MEELDYKKINRFAARNAAISIIVLVTLICLQWMVVKTLNGNGNVGRMVISMKADSQEKGGILLKNAGALENQFPGVDMTYINEQSSFLAKRNMFFNLTISMTDFRYAEFEGIKLFKGNYFTRDDSQEGRKVAVISKELAFKAFSTYNVIGSMINLWDHEKYKIIGVYEKPGSVLDFFADDGMERVYIPFQSVENSESSVIKTLMLKGESFKKDNFRLNKLEDFLKGQKINGQQYQIHDFYNASTLLAQPIEMLMFLLCIPVLIFLFIEYFGFVRDRAVSIRNSLTRVYYSELLRVEASNIIKIILATVIVILCIFSLFLAARFTPYISNSVIPPDNIFDFGFYMGRIKSMIQQANVNTGIAAIGFELRYIAAKRIITILDILIIVLIFPATSYLKLSRGIDGTAGGFLKLVAISLLSACLLCILCAYIFKLELGFPIRELFVFITYAVSGSLNHSIYKRQDIKAPGTYKEL